MTTEVDTLQRIENELSMYKDTITLGHMVFGYGGQLLVVALKTSSY